MSSTRHASPDRPIAHERYMSDTRYVERRPLNGRAVAEKAATIENSETRRLILFLQGVSVECNGLKVVADWLCENGGQWIGSPEMRRIGLNSNYNLEQVKEVRRSLLISGKSGLFPLRGENNIDKPHPWDVRHGERLQKWELAEAEANKAPVGYRAQVFADYCAEKLRSEIQQFLTELCIDPSIMPENFLWMDLAAALKAFEKHYSALPAVGTVETSITRKVCHCIDRAREVHRSSGPVPRHIVIVQGIEGVGKTSAAKAKSRQHLGEMRFVPLLGNVNLKDFFRAASRACGLPCGENLKAEQMKINVENFLRLTRMILVIDEAHRLFPDGNRVYAAPALMNWIYMLAELKAPVVMLVTPQFATRMDIVESCTDWRSGQLKRRVRSYEILPEKLTVRDLEAIAESRFPLASAGIIDEVVGYAGSTRYPLDAIHNIAEDAYRIAAEAGRGRPAFADVDRAINECARPTYAALTTQRDREMLSGSKSRRRGKGKGAAGLLPEGISEPAAQLPESGRALDAALGDEDTLRAGEPTKNRLRGFDLAGA